LRQSILKIAVPATIENVLQTLVGFFDTFLISRIGLVAVASVGLANTVLNVYLAIFLALGIGASSLIARHFGADQKEEAGQVAEQSVLLSLVIGLVLGGLTLLFGSGILAQMQGGEDVQYYGGTFFYLVGGTAVFWSLMTVFGSILRATGDAKSPLKVGAVVNILNVVLDAVLIFGLGPIPAMGILGTAIGTSVSRLLGCVLLYRKVKRGTIPFSLKRVFRLGNYQELVTLSIPAMMERLVMRVGQVVYFGLIAGLGVGVFASHSIAGSIESFVYMPAYGLATASATLAGQYFGAGDRKAARKVAFLSVKYGVLVMGLLGVVLFVGSPVFATFFTEDAKTIAQIVTALRIDAFAQPFLAISLIITGALQGIGDTKSPLYTTVIGIWVIRLLGVMFLAGHLGLGIAGIWIGIGVDLFIRSVYLTWRFVGQLRKADVLEGVQLPTRHLKGS